MPLILVRRGRFVRGDRLEDLIIQHLQNIFNHFFTSSKNTTIYPKPQKSEKLGNIIENLTLNLKD